MRGEGIIIILLSLVITSSKVQYISNMPKKNWTTYCIAYLLTEVVLQLTFYLQMKRNLKVDNTIFHYS